MELNWIGAKSTIQNKLIILYHKIAHVKLCSFLELIDTYTMGALNLTFSSMREALCWTSLMLVFAASAAVDASLIAFCAVWKLFRKFITLVTNAKRRCDGNSSISWQTLFLSLSHSSMLYITTWSDVKIKDDNYF